ncbi:phosphatidylserine/phosphatidylglycerophosphate/cardiolipin synthase family protein [Thioalkalivibrio sp. AKL19]|uniref:phospholipase D-like domain-containing protein n=1 Tax=Thioalkalivibrio sp. AKL19 TaxID=1266914 RepID=UPI001E3B5AEC|nr:phospholipase D-like domain-containing protein [Thioalkalivibrio sp. AKL19]
MSLNESRRSILWVIGVTVVATSLVLVLLQNLKTSGEVVERTIDHRYAIADPQFRREMSVLLGPELMRGNQVTALQNGEEIFPSMLAAIRSAQRSITFETHIYWSGEIGEAFSQALSERARAGVSVHVIIDWVGSTRMDQSLLDSMQDSGVLLHRYRPLRWYNLGRMNNRTHRKLLVVDGHIGFTGGVGIADQWTGGGGGPEQWRDTHFRIEGPVVAQLQAAFNDNWIKTTGRVLNGPTYFPPLQAQGEMDAHVFLASPSGGSESMHLMYLLAIAAAEATIDLAAAYFVPDKLLIEALVAARGRDVRVRILLPGPHIDAATVKIASKGDWGPLLRAGAEIHVYQPTMLHTKLLVIDAEFVSVGSTNFDIRSLRLNDEASLNIYNREFATQMTAVFERDLLNAERYSLHRWNTRPIREKVSEKLLLPIKSQL